ncbi:hypothetical protein PRIPAC_87110 [Pristionchus pacificus]|uniref:Uncharacterized protein n=1 Tax=Pristionchus pacificus TaxID=54126 RepID=A0A2A6CX98_PRIPA|nr:hypothetical protein PRIPAC_87110 [Pristionchus pacificus]|eukprot:PDM82842.1 hypothetical protein PRIPAC_37235 [Pristionchus pacificus]
MNLIEAAAGEYFALGLDRVVQRGDDEASNRAWHTRWAEFRDNPSDSVVGRVWNAMGFEILNTMADSFDEKRDPHNCMKAV